MPGRYYCFDGIDAGGKTTLINALYDELRKTSDKVVIQRYPSDKTIGKFIRENMGNPGAIDPRAYMHLFAADGLDCEKQMQDWINDGYIVLGDRHPFSSSFAYQVPLHSLSSMLDVCRPEYYTPPNVMFILDIPAAVALSRIAARQGKSDIYEAVSVTEIEHRRARYSALWTVMTNIIYLDGTRPYTDNMATVMNIMKQIDNIIFAKN